MKRFNHKTVNEQTPVRNGAEKVLEFNNWVEYNYKRLVDSGYMADVLNDVYISVYNRLMYSDFEIINDAYDKYICSDYFMQLKKNAYKDNRYIGLSFDMEETEQCTDLETKVDNLNTQIREVIKNMNAPTKKVFILVYFEKYNYKEVASKLNIPYSRVTSAYHRINKRVITEMQIVV